jgi:hypothetical protein
MAFDGARLLAGNGAERLSTIDGAEQHAREADNGIR